MTRAKIISAIIKRHFYVLAILFYVIATIFYMGPAFYKCNKSIYGFGDSTAGPIWKNSQNPQQSVLGSFTASTNYPKGENLYAVTNYASLPQSISMYISSKFIGPVCAYNMYNVVGYIFTATAMYLFMFSITRNKWVSLLSGYAVSFSPYFQAKVGAHPSYGYAGLLILVFWALLRLFSSNRKINSYLLGAAVSICAYIDPYFSLLAGIILIPSLLAWILTIIINKKYKKIGIKSHVLDKAKLILLAIVTFSILTAPLIYVRITKSDEIKNLTSSVRGDIKNSVKVYSNYISDYLIPDPMNIFLNKLLGSEYYDFNIKARHWCGPGECRVSVSLTLTMILLLGAIIIGWECLNKRKLNLSAVYHKDHIYLYLSLSLILGTAIILGLPPEIYGFTTPSGYIIRLTETWRVFSRVYVVVNFALIALSALVLHFFSAKRMISKLTARILVVLLFIFISAEYQINKPFSPPVFSYDKDVPSIYINISKNNNINAVAEYPIDQIGVEYDSVLYYLTMQTIHGKKILNSAAMVNENLILHRSIKDLTDPQSIPLLRYLGIKYLVIHGVTPEDIKNRIGNDVEIIENNTPNVYSLKIINGNNTNDLTLVKVKDGPVQNTALVIKDGYIINLDKLKSPLDVEFRLSYESTLGLISLDGSAGRGDYCFDVMAIGGGKINIFINSKLNSTITKAESYNSVKLLLSNNDEVKLESVNKSQLLLNNLGCRQQTILP